MNFPELRPITRQELMSTAPAGGPYVLEETKVGPIFSLLTRQSHKSIEQELVARVCEPGDPFLQCNDIDITIRPDGMGVVTQWEISRAARARILMEKTDPKGEPVEKA